MLLLSQDIDQYSSFAMLPKDISQQIFNKLVLSHLLTDVFLQKFRDCALEVIFPSGFNMARLSKKFVFIDDVIYQICILC